MITLAKASSNMQKLPIGEQEFALLRARNEIYVDKTHQIWELMNAGRFLFLSRPRRFGKSLLITTLEEIYRGNRALFQGLWIEDKIDWQPHPVIVINFNGMDYREQPLATALAHYLDTLAAQSKLTLHGQNYKEKFQELIVLLAQQGVEQGLGPSRVVLLVDEYDKPITDLLENEQKVQEHIDTLKNFYSVLKAPAAVHLHFVFLTGVSKYGKISVFSDLNNLLDLTLDRRFATLLGYTQEELEHYFAAYIDRLAVTYHADRATVLTQIQRWYDGYSWDGVQRVYVPFSTLVFLAQQRFANHWFATATPTFLIKLLRQQRIPAYTLERLTATDTLLDSANVDAIDPYALLFQTGYLTIKQAQPSFAGEKYILGYPNREVAEAFSQYLLADYLTGDTGQPHLALLTELQTALSGQDVVRFIKLLQSIFAGIPYTLFLEAEAYYHSVVYLVLRLLNFQIDAEKLTNVGRIDAVLELDNLVYILEFKMSTAAVAIQQIRDQGYAENYQGSGKTIVLLGIAFDKEKRNIIDWQSEPLPA
ncbi:MAG: AAA family ATPase [Caldilineaceae bacterium]